MEVGEFSVKGTHLPLADAVQLVIPQAGMGVPAARPYGVGVGCWIERSQERIF